MIGDPWGLGTLLGPRMTMVLLLWALYLGALVPLSAVVWFFGRKRVRWNLWDLAILVIPYAAWVSLMVVSSKGKSLSNLAESLYLGGIASMAPVARLIIADRINQKLLALLLVGFLCLVAAGFWALMPALPE